MKVDIVMPPAPARGFTGGETVVSSRDANVAGAVGALREMVSFAANQWPDQRAATFHVAMIAATLINLHSRPHSRPLVVSDLFYELPKPGDYMTVEQATAVLDSWATRENSWCDGQA